MRSPWNRRQFLLPNTHPGAAVEALIPASDGKEIVDDACAKKAVA